MPTSDRKEELIIIGQNMGVLIFSLVARRQEESKGFMPWNFLEKKEKGNKGREVCSNHTLHCIAAMSSIVIWEEVAQLMTGWSWTTEYSCKGLGDHGKSCCCCAQSSSLLLFSSLLLSSLSNSTPFCV